MTKKLALASVVILLLCVSLSFGGSRRAVLITDGLCQMFDGDGNFVTTEDVNDPFISSYDEMVDVKSQSLISCEITVDLYICVLPALLPGFSMFFIYAFESGLVRFF